LPREVAASELGRACQQRPHSRAPRQPLPGVALEVRVVIDQ
jgi:hypothetical protein